MNSIRTAGAHIALTAVLLCIPAPLLAQEAGDTVIKRGTLKEDLYLAGGTVEVAANVEGDVVAAGGQVSVDGNVSGDVMAAGGSVTVRGRIGDDVRTVGGNVTVSGAVGDSVVAAGGLVSLAPTAVVKGRAWLAGNTVNIAGNVGAGLKAAANRVVINGDVTGDVELYADTVKIEPGAVIRGNLHYHSPNEAQIASDAKITGTVTRAEFRAAEAAGAAAQTAWRIARVGFYVSLLLTAVVLYLLFPVASVQAARTIRSAPWQSLGLGVAILFAAPFVVMLLFATLVGAWLALTLLAAYLVLLLAGFLVGVLYAGDLGLRLLGKADAAGKGGRVLSLLAALIALWLIRFVPVLGGLAVFALLVFGTGALALYLWRRYAAAV